MPTTGDRELWRLETASQPDAFVCVMLSCCAGAELQVWRADEIVLRELYPTKSDLYERARALKQDLLERGAASITAPSGS